MDDQTIIDVVAEIEPLLIERAPGKIFQLSPMSLVIDFRLRDHGDLFISVERRSPECIWSSDGFAIWKSKAFR